MSKIQSNYQRFENKQSQNTAMNTSNLRFGSNGGQDVAAVAKKLANTTEKKSITTAMKVYDFLTLNEGELEAQLITALFTSTLAPLVIAYNPVSDKPKEDKQYVAWRQPLSAAIALAGGVPATILINKAFAKIGSEGYLESMDFRTAPHVNYLQSDFNKAYKNAKKNKQMDTFVKSLNLENEVCTSRHPLNFLGRIYDKSKLENAFAKTEKAKIANFFSSLISCPDINDLKFNEKTKEISIANSDQAPRKIPRINTLEDLQKYYNKHSIYRKNSFGDLMKECFGFKFYADKKLKPDDSLTKIKNILAKDFLEQIGLFEEIGAEHLSRVCGTARGSRTDIPNIVETQKVVSRQIDDKLGKDATTKSKVTLEQLLERFEIIEGTPEEKIKQLQDLMDKDINSVWEALKTKFEKFGEPLKKLDKDGKTEISKNYKDFAQTLLEKINKTKSEHFKNLIKIHGLLGNLVVVLFTCSALNWAYPRFMDKFLPELSKKKKNKGGIKNA